MDEDCLDDDANDSCFTDDRTVAVSNVNPERVVLTNRNKPVRKQTVKTQSFTHGAQNRKRKDQILLRTLNEILVSADIMIILRLEMQR